MSAKILFLDIETAPNKVYTWGLWEQNVGLEQIIQPGYMLSWSAKWLGDKKILSDSLFNYRKKYKENPTDDSEISKTAWALIDEADIVVAHNGLDFDLKWLNAVFLKNGLQPASTIKVIDTLKVARANFRFLSNKLDFLSKTLGIGEKLKHEGFGLWVKCMSGDAKAWKRMIDYNKKDVKLLEDIYMKLRPFISNHPNLALYSDLKAKICPNCLSPRLRNKGYAYTATNKYTRYVCRDCGKNTRDRKSILTKVEKSNIISNVT